MGVLETLVEIDEPHLSKLFDVHMLQTSTGRERTVAEYDRLIAKAGWELETAHAGEAPMGVVEARAT